MSSQGPPGPKRGLGPVGVRGRVGVGERVWGCAGPQLPRPLAWGVGKWVTGDPVPLSPRSPERVGEAGRGARWIINPGALGGAGQPYWSPALRPVCPWKEAALLVPPGPSPSLSLAVVASFLSHPFLVPGWQRPARGAGCSGCCSCRW